MTYVAPNIIPFQAKVSIEDSYFINDHADFPENLKWELI